MGPSTAIDFIIHAALQYFHSSEFYFGCIRSSKLHLSVRITEAVSQLVGLWLATRASLLRQAWLLFRVKKFIDLACCLLAVSYRCGVIQLCH